MPVAPDIQALIDSAERAAAAGDLVSAEQYLRLAAEQQEAAGRPDEALANTLNNLGVVCEQLAKPAEAERCYRRAHEVASAVLPAEHPTVALSEKNLRDFCEARNIPFLITEPQPPRDTDRQRDTPPVAVAEPVREEPALVTAVGPSPGTVDSVATRSRKSMIGVAIGTLTIAVAVVIVLQMFKPGESARTAPPAVEVPPQAPAVAATSASPTAEGPAPAPAATTPAPRVEAPVATLAPRATERSTAVPTLLNASLCRTLDTGAADWKCGAVAGDVSPGPLYFYTRVASPVDTTVEHRWYRNGRLHQAISLRVRASADRGYRTYSRASLTADRAGNWRVELRGPGGSLLHQEQFDVR
jgi:hypothetical protein